MPYMIALRHSMLSSGFTVGLIEVYQRRAMVGLSTIFFFSGSLSTWLIAAGWTPVPARSTSMSPVWRRWSMSSALTLSWTS